MCHPAGIERMYDLPMDRRRPNTMRISVHEFVGPRPCPPRPPADGPTGSSYNAFVGFAVCNAVAALIRRLRKR